MMYKLFDSLVENFGFKKAADGSVSRKWEKEVEVAWYGKQMSHFEVIAYPWAGGSAARVCFLKNGRIEKEKIYSSGYARTLNAIRATVTYNEFEL